MIREELALVKQNGAWKPRRKKGWSGLFYPPNGLNFQFCWFNLIFLIAPSWSESNFILFFIFLFGIRIGPSRSGPTFVPASCRTGVGHIPLGQPQGDGNLSIPSTETAKQSLIMKHEGLSSPNDPGRNKGKLMWRSLLRFRAPQPERPGELQELARRLVRTACPLYRELEVKQ